MQSAHETGMIPLPRHPLLDQSLRHLKGVGPNLERVLNQRGLYVLGDLLNLMPREYQDRRKISSIGQLVADQNFLILGHVRAIKSGRFPKTGRPYLEVTVWDGTGRLLALWFNIPAHFKQTLKVGTRVLLYGQVKAYKNLWEMVHPELSILEGDAPPALEVRPNYPEIEGVKPGILRRIMAAAQVELGALPAIFPLTWLESQALTDPIVSLKTLHQPPADRPGRLPRPEASKAWRNLAFFELLFLQLTLLRSKARQVSRKETRLSADRPRLVKKFLDNLPFRLTEAQRRALIDIYRDLASPRPMNRLLQGEVGAGKTVVALAAAFGAVERDRQAAIMVPTEALANQHFRTIHPQAEHLGIASGLLVGSLTDTEKARLKEELAAGRVRIVVGTQALISPDVQFKELGLVIIDEQHRFGVAQRLALRAKTDQADLLVMTATPIPRSLAMTYYGDLDVSSIHGRLPGRRPVMTRVFQPKDRGLAYQLLAREVMAGGQAYVLAPRIEAADSSGSGNDLAAAEDLYKFVSERVLPKVQVGLVHGRMKAEEQERTLALFRQGEIRALVATTVIEVGLDVPGASLMLIEGAERFGLAQLHQLRGRVGRGDRLSQCFLVAGQANAARLGLLARISDGFVLAEEDLKRRGPGDPAGWRQSGLPSLIWAKLPRDLPLLHKARALAEEIIGHDPDLSAPNFKLVREVVEQLAKRIEAETAGIG